MCSNNHFDINLQTVVAFVKSQERRALRDLGYHSQGKTTSSFLLISGGTCFVIKLLLKEGEKRTTVAV